METGDGLGEGRLNLGLVRAGRNCQGLQRGQGLPQLRVGYGLRFGVLAADELLARFGVRLAVVQQVNNVRNLVYRRRPVPW